MTTITPTQLKEAVDFEKSKSSMTLMEYLEGEIEMTEMFLKGLSPKYTDKQCELKGYCRALTLLKENVQTGFVVL